MSVEEKYDERFKKMKQLADKASRSKELVLDRGGFTPIPHTLFRNTLPELKNKYDGVTARDCLTLYMYLFSFVNGESEKDYYMWAFPTIAQINNETGIHKDRIKRLTDILESEKLVESIKVPWNGNSKKMFLPILP